MPKILPKLLITFMFFLPAWAYGEEYSSTWGPDIGTSVTLSAPDQIGEVQTLESLRGENGLLVFFNRSADW